jgi:hypothetical protein
VGTGENVVFGGVEDIGQEWGKREEEDGEGEEEEEIRFEGFKRFII